ncbi:MAG: sigma-54-dependent Fis family transcriptional regulator [Gammaproteobacteria bacterium]|nr:sigma-54-dependent Fis family transcriptional regulator [Gammaproteobacteria bacterium]
MKQQVLIIEDSKTLNNLIASELSTKYKVHSAYNWQQAKAYLEAHEPDIIISDLKLPDAWVCDHIQYLVNAAPTILLTAYANVGDAVTAIKAGVSEYLVKPILPEKLILTIDKIIKTNELQFDYQFFKKNLKNEYKDYAMIGNTDSFNKMKELILAVAPSDASVLITGESGTGKELIARHIHESSTRTERNFVAVDCCTIAENMFESELFGHEKGSFTGADKQKKGLIEEAKGGSLFLDEIGEIDPKIQAKLLRVIETGTFRRLGGNKVLNSNVRIISATNRQNLLEMGESGAFRSDLYYRLNVFSIIAPPLRERRKDIELLANFFLKNHKFSQCVDKEFTSGAIKKLNSYHWPGNIRELKNVIERSIILSANSKQIREQHLAFDTGQKADNHVNLSFAKNPSLDELTGQYLTLLLDEFSGHRHEIAIVLGVSERSVYRMIKRYDLGD